jgi:tetratricopeptide (TPR) repeat protein
MVMSARELIFGRADRLKVFVSSKMAGGVLKDERSACVRGIERFPSMRAWAWERDAVAGTYYSDEECVGNAATSEALVLILEDELTDVTRKEYLAAKRAGAHRIIFHRTGVARTAPLQRFIERERRRDAVTAGYGNVSELETRLFEALREFGVRPVRERMLRLRESSRSAPRAYDELDICVGEDEESMRPLSEAIGDARQLVQDGEADEAFELMYDFIEQALSVGLVSVAVHLVEDLRDIVPASAIDERREGWVLNLEGRALGATGDAEAARQRLDRMRQLGRSLGDLDLESTALQNLGVQEVIAGNHDDAARLYRDALKLKEKLGDTYGGLQVLLNHVNVMAGQGRIGGAHALLDDLGEIIQELRLPDLRTSVAGHRAQLFIEVGELDRARGFLLEALRIARRAGLPDRELLALRNLARLDHDRGAHRQSLAWARKALAIAESLGDRVQEEIVQRNVASALYESNNIDESVLHFVAAAEIAEELGDAQAHAESLGNAAACLTQAGRPDDAIKMLEVALSSSAHTHDEWRARQLENLAIAYSAAGRAATAIETLERAAKLTPNWEDEAGFLRRAAHIALGDVGSARRASELLDAELTVRRKHQQGREWAWAAAEMGAILSHTSQAAHASQFFTAALRVFAATGDLQRAFAVRNDRAIAASKHGDLRAARADLRHSLDVARGLADRALERQAVLNLSEIERRAGNDAVAREYAGTGLRLARESEDPAEETAALLQVGLVEGDQGDLDAAERTLKEAVRLARSLSSRPGQAGGHKHLAQLDFLRGRFAKAAKAYRRSLALMDDDDDGSQRAEALGGAIMADARRGRVDENLVQEFVDVVQAVGWEQDAGEELFDAAHSLLLRRRPSPAAEMLALSVLMELRLRGDDQDELSREILMRLAQLIALAGATRQSAFVRRLRGELRRHLTSDAFDPLIDTTVELARSHRAKSRDEP